MSKALYIDKLEKRIKLITRKKNGCTPTWTWEADNAEEVEKFIAYRNELRGLKYALNLAKEHI